MPDSPATYETIGVIVGRDLVGDALIKLPFLRALRNAFPTAAISWITSQGPTAFAHQLREPTTAFIDRIYEQPEWLRTHGEHGLASGLMTFARHIIHPPARLENRLPNAPFFELLIDTRNRWRETVFARQIPHRVFISPAMQFLFSDRRPPFLGSRPLHLCDRLIELIQLAAGFTPPSTGALPVSDDMMGKARRILPEGPIYIGLAPGAGFLAKAWPRYKFEKVALFQAQKDRVPVFILGPQELSWYDELAATVPNAKFPLQEHDIWGTTIISVEQTLALGRILDVAVANDSGVGHMLAAADCPLISLFGPTSPAKLAPRVSHGTVLRAQNFGGTATRLITWEAVNDTIEAMLAKRAAATPSVG